MLLKSSLVEHHFEKASGDAFSYTSWMPFNMTGIQTITKA